MKASIITAIAALGLAATPALASTATAVKTTRAATHRSVAQICQSERAMAKEKKVSWKIASERCNAAKHQAKLAVGKAKYAQRQTHGAAKTAKKG